MAVSFDFTSEQEELRRQAAEFAVREIAPMAEEIDEKDDPQLVLSLMRKMAQPPYEYLGMFIPKEYGGNPRSILDICIVIEEIAAGGKCAMGGVMIEAGLLSPGTFLQGASEEQKKKYLPIIAKGEGFITFCLTEPGIGSDAAALRTEAKLDGDGYILNGSKRYASFAHVANYHVVFAKTDPSQGARGISSFIVPGGNPGFTVTERVPCIGMRGHQDEEVIIENCRVPKENLIGEAGRGLKYALGALDDSRITLTCGFIGLSRAALEEGVRFAKARKAFGQPIAEFQAISFPLTEVAIEIEAARLLAYKAAWMADNKIRHTAETAAAKAFASQLVIKSTNVAMDVHGGFGGTKRFPIERMLRDGRIWIFAQGTPNVQKLIVMRDLFQRLEPSAELVEEIAGRA
ncbi:MAG: acyl-CoA dehydrogenase family protein [Chloroflexota bacterium]|nr:acyl-CoA dehydrogenase family protein [Chloroflexota bacterium]